MTQLHARLAALDIEREAIEQDSVFYPETSPERLADCLLYTSKEQRPLSERDKIDINKNNFNSVMAEFSPAVNLTVEDTLNGNGNERCV